MALPGLFRTILFWPIEMRPRRIRGGGFCGQQKPICLRMSGYDWMSGGTTCQTVRARRSWRVVPVTCHMAIEKPWWTWFPVGRRRTQT